MCFQLNQTSQEKNSDTIENTVLVRHLCQLGAAAQLIAKDEMKNVGKKVYKRKTYIVPGLIAFDNGFVLTKLISSNDALITDFYQGIGCSDGIYRYVLCQNILGPQKHWKCLALYLLLLEYMYIGRPSTEM